MHNVFIPAAQTNSSSSNWEEHSAKTADSEKTCWDQYLQMCKKKRKFQCAQYVVEVSNGISNIFFKM